MNWRTKTEYSLEKMGEKISLHPKKIIFIILALSLFLISNLPHITIDTSTEGFLHENDPTLIRYEEFKKQFGQDEMIMIGIKTKNIFDLSFLQKLKELHNELENTVPHLNDINSLINARNTRGEGNVLVVEDLFENWPENEQDLEYIKQRAMQNVLYKNLLLNEELTLTAIMLEPNAYESSEETDDLEGFGEEVNEDDLEFISDKSKSQMVRSTDEIVKKYNDENFQVYVAGSLAINDFIKRSIQKDIQIFIKLSLLMIAIFLYIVFRRVSAVLLPLFIVILSLLSTIGVMALSQTPITIPTQILPSFLLAVGVGAAVHLLAMFFKHFNEHGLKEKAISFSLGHSGLAIAMTSLTTAAGLLSFSTAEVAPIADLGIFAAVGVMIALVNTLILLPAILTVLPLKQSKSKAIEKAGKMDDILKNIAVFSLHHAKTIVGLGFIIFIVFAYFASEIKFKHDPLLWHPEDSSAKIATYTIDKELKGSVTMEVLLDTKKDNGLYDAQLLQKIDGLRKKIEESSHSYSVAKAWSVAEVLKEIHKALHENQEKYYAITDNNALIPQEILLFENSGSDDLEDLVDASFSQARMTVKLPWMEASEYTTMITEIQSIMEDELGDEVEVVITGMVPLFQRTLVAAMHSMSMSYYMAFFFISIMMILLLGSVKVGLVSMIPNVLPVIMSLGFMQMTGMPLDLFTMLVGAIVIGLSVDDTVHFFHNFSRYRHDGLSIEDAVKQTMLGTGRAMVATTIVLSLGFYIYIFASLSNLINFGIITGSAIIIALISDILLAPALLKLLYSSKEK